MAAGRELSRGKLLGRIRRSNGMVHRAFVGDRRESHRGSKHNKWLPTLCDDQKSLSGLVEATGDMEPIGTSCRAPPLPWSVTKAMAGIFLADSRPDLAALLISGVSLHAQNE